MTRTFLLPISILALAIAWLAAAASCGVAGTGLLISDAQEAQLGAQVHEEVIAEFPLIEDPEIDAWVHNLGNRLADASLSVRTGVTYRFHVLDADMVNAFAAPGGYIYLTRGLILAASSEAEVAGVLGHEVGHVSRRHGVARLERAVAVGLVTDLIFGDGTFGAEAVNFVAVMVLQTGYSRDQERDADLEGVDYTYGASINPLGIADFFDRLAEAHETSSFDWLNSHPDPAERAAATRQRIQELHPGFDRSTPGYAFDVTGDFESIRGRLAN